MGSSQAAFIFFSSFSVLLIALDRYRLILHPTDTQITVKKVNLDTVGVDANHCFQATILSLISLLVSLIISLPLFLVTELQVYTNIYTGGIISFCFEVKISYQDNI